MKNWSNYTTDQQRTIVVPKQSYNVRYADLSRALAEFQTNYSIYHFV